jgi:selenocysteine-specific elongation factor
MIIGTAGHIDHGKTSLVRALTGVDTDRLKEEKSRGISIELGYAYLPLESGDILGFVDVPGHEKFINHMLAGATGIDFALLVVAADDGVMPQTREHLQILHWLKLSRGAVVLTKIDAVEPSRVGEVAREVQLLLESTRLTGAPVFPVSSVTGQGLPELKAFLAAQAHGSTQPKVTGYFRLAVDRSFTIKGAGTVVTGTVYSGEIRVGDEVVISPTGLAARVRAIHAQNREVQTGHAGQRCALNLAGTAVNREAIARGDWVVDPFLHAPSSRIDTLFSLSVSEGKPLRHWTPVHFHLGAAHLTAHVALLEGDTLAPGESGLVQLVLANPGCAWHGDQFILRDQSAQRTLGGGTVLDPFAPSRHRRAKARIEVLRILEQDEPYGTLQNLLKVSSLGIDLKQFRRSWNLMPGDIEAVRTSLRCMHARETEVAFSLMHWQELKVTALVRLGEFHARFPDEMGPDATRLRRLCFPQLEPAAYAALIDEILEERKIFRIGPWLHLPSHDARLSEPEQALAQKILPLIENGHFDPPWVRDIARQIGEVDSKVRALLLRLTRSGEVFQVVRDLFYGKSAVAGLAAIARDINDASGAIRAAEFRDRSGLGRKRAIQILEFFDRIGFARRVRDTHRLRSDSLLALDSQAGDQSRLQQAAGPIN